jgi:hypothetical protein
MKKVHKASKRSSIALMEDDFRQDSIEDQAKIPVRKGLSFSNHNQSSSLKTIQQKKSNQKKMSVFRPIQCESQVGVKIKKTV